MYLEVLGNFGMSCHIGKEHVSHRCNDDGTNGQAVQPIGEVHRIGGAHNDQGGKGDIPDAKIWSQALKKGNGQFTGKVGAVVNQPGDPQASQYL